MSSVAARNALATGEDSPNPPEVRALASQHFHRGVKHAEKGDLEAAIEEFEAALRLEPHPSVLLNLGEAYAASGRSVAAVEKLSSYLEQLGATLDAHARRRVEEIIQIHSKRLAYLRIDAPSTSELWIDGRKVDPAAARQPYAIVAGPHSVVVRSSDGRLQAEQVQIKPGETRELAFRRAQDAQKSGTEPGREPGVLEPRCAVPGADLRIAGQNATAASEGVRLLDPGGYVVRFSRAGYRTSEHRVRVEPGRKTDVQCQLKPLANPPRELLATLRVDVAPAGADVFLDGEPMASSTAIAGPHRLSVQAAGFEPWEKDIELRPAETKGLSIALAPTREYTEAQNARAESLRTWGYISTGVGVGFAVTAGVLAAVSAQEFDTWQGDAQRLRAEQDQLSQTEAEQRYLALQDSALKIRRLDDMTIVSGVAAGGFIAVGVGFLLEAMGASSPDAELDVAIGVDHLGARYRF